MIVARFFEGDEDMETAGRQHDVYVQALGVIVEMCNRVTRVARALLDDKAHGDWGSIVRFDHRTLQGAHDILAAVWRSRHDVRQFELPLERPFELIVSQTTESRWLWWLRTEIEGWVWEPELVRNVQLILTNQNQSIGYTAESELGLALLNRFEDVLLLPALRDAFERDLARQMRDRIQEKSCTAP